LLDFLCELYYDERIHIRQINGLINKTSIPTKRATVILIEVKLCNALLRLLLVCICCYLKSVIRLKILTF